MVGIITRACYKVIIVGILAAITIFLITSVNNIYDIHTTFRVRARSVTELELRKIVQAYQNYTERLTKQKTMLTELIPRHDKIQTGYSQGIARRSRIEIVDLDNYLERVEGKVKYILSIINGADKEPNFPLQTDWMDVDHAEIIKRYPGIVFLPHYPLKQLVDNMQAKEAEEHFFKFVTTNDLYCEKVRRMGNELDGGWDVCTSKPYTPKQDECIVYSVGINNDWSFDDDISRTFGCHVYAFDPSMGGHNHNRSKLVHFFNIGLSGSDSTSTKGWDMMTFKSMRRSLGHSSAIIDVLKFDIDYHEWIMFPALTSDGSLNNVKQLMFEIHTPEVAVKGVNRTSTKQDYYNMWAPLQQLQQLGFRQFHHHMNPFGMFNSSITGQLRTCCYEMYLLNVNFLKQPHDDEQSKGP